MNKAAVAIATWFGCGYAPKAPGTAGAAAALAIAAALHALAGMSQWEIGVLGAAAILPGVWASGVTSRTLGSKDPQIAVVDEVAGQWIALAGARELTWWAWIAAFALFRLFDIVKPPPVRQLEDLPGGWGVMADDAMAGVYAAAVLFLAGRFGVL